MRLLLTTLLVSLSLLYFYGERIELDFSQTNDVHILTTDYK